jgi:hypothetical protein
MAGEPNFMEGKRMFFQALKHVEGPAPEVSHERLIIGATGIVGDGVLRWLIASPEVTRVVAVSRKRLSVQ